MPAGKVDVVITANGVQYTRTMQAATSAARQFGSANKAAGDGAGYLVSKSQAASGAIRVLEGNVTNNIRAAERFVSTLPGVGAALQAAFPVIGGIALAGVLGTLAKRAYDFIHAADQVPESIRNSFQASIESLQSANDATQESIDKVKNEIAILQNRPQNLLAEELDRSRREADDLATSLHKASDEFRQLMKQNNISAFGGFVTNQATTANTGGTIGYYKQQQADIAAQLAEAREADDKQQIAALNKQLADSQASEKTWLERDLAQQKANNDPRDWAHRTWSNTVSTQGNQNLDTGELRDLAERQRGTSTKAQLDKANDQKDALEAQKKAAADRLKQMQEDLAMEKAQYGMSIAQELAYWSSKLSAFTRGSEQYNTVLMQQLTLQQNLYKEMEEGKKSYLEHESEDFKQAQEVLRAASEAMNKVMTDEANDAMHTGEAWKGYNQAVGEGAQQQVKMAASLQTASIQMQLQMGQITKHAAALALAAVHAKEYEAAMNGWNGLKDQQWKIQHDPSLTDAQRSAELQKNANQQAQLTGEYRIQQQSDVYASSSSTFGGASLEAINKMVGDWEDMTHSIVDNVSRTVESLNTDLAAALVGNKGKTQHLSWSVGSTLHQSAEGLAKTGIQKLEGTVLGKFGLGPKAQLGTKSNPMYTINADGAVGANTSAWLGKVFGGGGNSSNSSSGGGSSTSFGSVVSNVSGWLKKVFGGGDSDDSDSDSSSGGGNFFSNLFQGKFAGGGDVLANRPALIGERGPELFVPKTAGRILPNGAFGGNHTYHIDARGSHDPAMTEAAVRRAMHSTMNQAVTRSVAATREGIKRQPKNAGL